MADRRTGGSVMCWGDCQDGGCGDGATEIRPTPVMVSGLSDARQISAGGWGGTACALRATGEVVCWGSNSSGELGSGEVTIEENVPVPVVSVSDAAEVSVGGAASGWGAHTCIRRTSGAVDCFGSNAVGQLGDGSRDFAPTRVLGLP